MQQRTTSPEAKYIQKRQYETPRNLDLKNDILEVQIFSFLIVLFGFINRFWSLKVLHKNILAQAANLLDAPLVDDTHLCLRLIYIQKADDVAFGKKHEDESSASEAAFQSDGEDEHDVR